ncbi:hypothetical protein A3J90_02680 [candidate division WOR-1 bacterium RIFOXYC2_FULL_37_10]|uniref:3-oxoacyl-ACP synthase n=1 Tax=candidate division WOR-1 bacterium RIFOXYB2_FULL_37_13 TaxID=1802579 RepID=A0A1F4SHS4_UNCSA|nr:MAG: hypothetical protein A2246_02915 [candidate division WOR-1 bacterium RIFOXYA2_FULL_37_7]OGC19970.1 MAG: hypothetical protein A2310_01250 [candidate division WOR-1 bacterium RIFOXYB2_FULL_37_13]OGC36617.1 MAG: hypothetical protein A3J90_02680 [candidate division WOR-1 bacterium RIFOXYC2_FULL_37_10]
MKIETIIANTPSLEISNEWIIEEIEKQNPDSPKNIIKIYQRQVLTLLKKSGSKTRVWRDRQKGEVAFDLIKKSIKEALKKSDLKQKDIDLLIYCGVGKGFKEPANAYMYARALNMNAQCFDISDACMSWVRSLEIAYRFIKSGHYKHVMIINGEFNVYEHLYPYLWKIKNLKQIEYTLPAYTIGEAATATIVSPSEQVWTFDYVSAPELSNLCSIPIEGFEGFIEKDDKINLHGINRFVSFGADLFSNGKKILTNLTKEVIKDIDSFDIWFPHAASETLWLEMGQELGILPEKNYTKVYPNFGNLVSASIPVGIDLAEKENKIKRGDSVVLWPGSAGMSFCIAQFTY